MYHTSVRELWDVLDRKYVESDARHEIYVNDQYHEYKMVHEAHFSYKLMQNFTLWYTKPIFMF
jgi:hypothetical protein